MNKKISCPMICMIMIVSAMTTIIITTPVKGSEGQNQGINSPNPLNMTYIWKWTKILANVTYKAYPPNEIPRGRSYGSLGGNYTKNILLNEMDMNLSLQDTHPEQIKHINRLDVRTRNYTSVIWVNDFQLTVNNQSYTLPHNVSKKESYGYPSAFPPQRNITTIDHNYIFTNEKIQPINITDLWPFGGTYNDYSLTVTNYTILNNQQILAGNVSYLSSSDPLPDANNQLDMVYLMNESEECQNKLDNLTSAAGCILIHDDARGYTANTAKCCYPVARINQSAGVNIKEILDNYSMVLVDNINENLTFTYNLDFGWWPESDFVFIDRIPNHYELKNRSSALLNFILKYISGDEQPNIGDYLFCYGIKTIRFWEINQFKNHSGKPQCKGFILYDTYNQHYVQPAVNIWENPSGIISQFISNFTARSPALPTFFINNTVGAFLKTNRNGTTISGYLNETFRAETPNQPGVNVYNVVGNITNPNNHAKDIAIISSRYDGQWGQTPGDSGCGNAVVLGLAKYFSDNNITPKYNLTFLFTTGEEFGLRGAQYYNDSHNNDTIKFWFVLDELAFNQSDTVQEMSIQNQEGHSNLSVFRAIINESHYEDRTEYTLFPPENFPILGTEQGVYSSHKDIENVIGIAKDKYYEWDQYHRSGNNYTDGDALKYIDRNDLNVSAELAWNLSRYFLVNPNCWFENLSYEAFNTTGGTAPDTLKTIYKIKSVLPNDRVMIHATFYNRTGVEKDHRYYNITVNRTGVTHTITFSLPSGIKEGDYYVTIEAYNSTARINRLAGVSYSANDSGTSPKFHLNRYHTFGDIRIGVFSDDVCNIIRASEFTVTEDALVHNITAHVHGSTLLTPTYQCMIYRASDGHLIGSTGQVQRTTSGWYAFSFNPMPMLKKNTQYYLSIWGNTIFAMVSFSPQESGNGWRNGSYTFGSPPQIIGWNPNVTARQYSLFCRYTLDAWPPVITNVTHSPDTVGFGYNVTINATVTDNFSGVNLVKVQITPPSGSSNNYTMTHITGNIYQYVFSNTWTAGQYNYTIWAVDNASNVNSSGGHHFHVSANATIRIATLKDSYTGNQFINITDPPNPPQNLTLIGRGLTWNTYYNASSGENILETFQGPVNFQEDNGNWTPINNTIGQLTNNHPAYVYGYRTGNNHGLYGVYFKSNAQNDWPVAFAYNRSDDPTIHAIRSKLVGVGYVDPQSNWAYQYLQNVQSSQGQTNDYSITYPGVFTGTDVTWSYGNTGLKEEITMSNTTKTVLQNHPPSQYGLNDASSYLVFITKLDYQNLNIYNSSGLLDGNVTISDAGVDFKDVLGQFKCALPIGEAYEMNNESVRQKLTYRIIHLNGATYLLSGLKVSDLNAMTFPVVIDPTLTVYSISSDGYIYNSGSNYNTVQTASSGTVSSSGTYITIGQNKVANFPPTFYIYRGFVFFNTSALPSNAYLDNATLSIYKKDDYSTTDFDITIQNGQPTYPHNPMQTGDYFRNYYSGNGGTLGTSRFTSGYNAITMSDLNWINKTGITKLCLRSSRDISGTTPTGNEYVNVYSNEFLGMNPPRLVINYRNQSKIKNTGSTDIKGYLLIQIQFYNTSQAKWLLDNDTINETTSRIITSGNQLALDTIFNGHVRASDLTHGTGTYRVYGSFRDPEGNILRTNDDVGLEAWWQFNKT